MIASTTLKSVRPNVILSSSRDLPILHFLWKWKFATTAELAQYFSDLGTVNAIYLRLWRLEKAGFIRSRADESARCFFWSLDRKGYAALRPHLPDLREEGFLSENMRHDLFTSAIHLGDRIFGPTPGIKYFSEQELRRIDPKNFPIWVPQTTRRRPDGYWLIETQTDSVVIALEVELSQKAEVEYEGIGRFYSDHREIGQTLWIVSNASLLRKIQPVLDGASRNGSRHSFVELETVFNLGWHASISKGFQAGKSIASILQNCSTNGPQVPFGHFSFDTRKSPHLSKHCELFRPLSFPD